MTVSLTNTSRRCLVFVLAHESYCKSLGACQCDVQPGRLGRRIVRSLTLASGVTSPPVEDAVLAVPDVVRAIRRGDISVKRHVSALPTPISTKSAVRHDAKAPNAKTKNKRGAS